VLAAIIPVAAGTAVPAPRAVHGVFGSAAPSVSAGLAAASLQPPASPRPAVAAGASSVALEWSPVTSTASGSIEWTVRRTSASGTSVVCAATGAVVSSSASVSCTDSSVQRGVTYSYTVQPQLWRFSTPTWSLPEGPSSDATALAGTVFASSGTVVTTTTTGTVDVPYPAGTEPGDLLILLVVNGRNRPPTRTTGWTDVASSGIGGQSDFHLYVGQRIAETATSAPVTVDGRAGGVALQVLRYDTLPGAPVPRLAAAQQVFGTSAQATVQFVPSPDLATTANATALSVVAVRNQGDISLAAPSGWTRRVAATVSTGGVPLAWALADTFVVQPVTVPSPTWQQAGSPVSRWIFAGSAFG
jgi:hypothetical protein